MAPAGPNRDSDSSTSNDKDENPFIKFKRFADAQIGAVLQGVIGLPSVFSKQPNDAANSRWADLHDDLKRRDETRAEQRASPGSDSTNSEAEAGCDDEEVDLPVKRWQDWSLPTPTTTDSFIGDNINRKDPIDLYSPLTKSLFSHLIRRPVDDVDWTKFKYPPRVPQIPFGPEATSLHYIGLYNDVETGSVMEAAQKSVLCSFNSIARSGESPPLQNTPSILPYILFSPYSPLALSSGCGPSRGETVSVFDKEDDFPYWEAFQDLLLASQGRSMSSLILVPGKYKPKPTVHEGFEKAFKGLHWIDTLSNYGLLTRDPPLSIPLVGFGCAPYLFKFENKDLYGKDSKLSRLPRAPDTEIEENYVVLDDPAGQIKNPVRIEDVLASRDRWKHYDDVTGSDNISTKDDPHSCEHVSSRATESDSTQDGSGVVPRYTSIFGKRSSATQTEAFSHWGIQHIATNLENSEHDPAPQSGQTGDDQVVSTTTTSHHVTKSDGSVETTVTVRKSYADGRELITTTSKAHVVPICQYVESKDYGNEDYDEDYNEDRCPYCDTKYHDEEERPKRQTPEKRGKGWFWN